MIDLDGTLCELRRPGESYAEVAPRHDVVEALRRYRAAGFYIIIATARNMRTYDGNLGLINANTAQVALAWLARHEIPFDEIHFGKPWPGPGGFYVDDRTIRPDEFVRLAPHEIQTLLGDAD